MKKIILKGKRIKTLEGKDVLAVEKEGEIPMPLLIGRQIGQILSSTRNSNEFTKLWGLAQRFYNDDSITLDDADIKTVIDTISATDMAAVSLKAQCIEVLESGVESKARG